MCMNITAPARLTHPFGVEEFPMIREEIIHEEPELEETLKAIPDERLKRLPFINPISLTIDERKIVTAAMLAHQRNRIFSVEAIRRWENEKD